jgi:hypothetical protein
MQQPSPRATLAAAALVSLAVATLSMRISAARADAGGRGAVSQALARRSIRIHGQDR